MFLRFFSSRCLRAGDAQCSRIGRGLALAVLLGAKTALGDVATEWNEALTDYSHAAISLPLVLEVRAYALTHVALADALKEAMASRHSAETRAAEARAAASTAAHAIAVALLPAGAAAFDALHARQLGECLDTAARSRGEKIGRDAAARLLAKRQDDGWAELAALREDSPRLVSLAATDPDFPDRRAKIPESPWRAAVPLALRRVEQFAPIEPYAVSREGEIEISPAMERATTFHRVMTERGVEEVARTWSGRPLVMWNRVAQQLARQSGSDIAANAGLFAMLNLAFADAMLAARHWQFTIGNWRRTTTEVFAEVPLGFERDDDLSARLNETQYSVRIRPDIHTVMLPPTPNFPALAPVFAGAAEATFSALYRSREIHFAVDGERAIFAEDAHVFTRFESAARECTFAAMLEGATREACLSGHQLGFDIGKHLSRARAAVRRR